MLELDSCASLVLSWVLQWAAGVMAAGRSVDFSALTTAREKHHFICVLLTDFHLCLQSWGPATSN